MLSRDPSSLRDTVFVLNKPYISYNEAKFLLNRLILLQMAWSRLH